MRKKIAIVLLMCMGAAAFGFADDLYFEGWSAWGGLRAEPKGNIVTLNGKVNAAGYVTADINTALKNKTVILEIQNAENSVFTDGRLIKISVNKDDRVLQPLNVPGLIFKEYISAACTLIEFVLPADFDGKLGFVFYQAELKDLKITATYK
jgi:hypothetical protein